jgi:hypothetical protein
MPTEVTSTLLVGPMRSFWGGAVTDPSHVLVLREGFRATWSLYPVSGQAPAAPVHIRPAVPEHLVASALMGFALVIDPTLGEGVEDWGRRVRRGATAIEVDELDGGLAQRVLLASGEHFSVVATVLTGSTIESEVAEMEAAGFTIARPARGPLPEAM